MMASVRVIETNNSSYAQCFPHHDAPLAILAADHGMGVCEQSAGGDLRGADVAGGGADIFASAATHIRRGAFAHGRKGAFASGGGCRHCKRGPTGVTASTHSG